MLQIGTDKQSQSNYETLVQDKKNAYNNLLDHVKQFIQLDEIDFTTEDLNNEIISKVLNKHSSSFPSILKSEKVLELLDFSVHKLQALTERFKSIQVDFDVISQECPTKDFGIYTQNKEQVNKWFQIVNLADEVNRNLETISQGIIPRNQLSVLLGNVIIYDHTEHRFKPNIKYILSI